jgi:hypothetical protein
MATQEIPTRVVNQAFFDKITSNDPGLFKKAADTVSEFTRVKMREDGFLRKILPPVPVTNSDLDRMVHSDKPVIIVDKEPGSPAAVSLPFAQNPISRYIRGIRYPVIFQRIATPKFTKDVDELRTYDMDIRQVLSDNAIKDMLAEEDGKWLAACNAGMGTRDDGTTNETGIALWNSQSGAINRSNLVEARKTMPSTFAHLEASTGLINNISVKEIEKWQRDQVGGDLSEDILIKGFSEREFMGIQWIVTIKTDLVRNGTVFFFAEPKFLGKNFLLEDTTMYIDRRAYMLEFFAYESIGAALGNVAAVTRTDFAGTYAAGPYIV